MAAATPSSAPPQPQPGESQSAYDARLKAWLSSTVGVGAPVLGNIAPVDPVSTVQNVASGINTTAQLAGNLMNPNFWVRIGEFVVGGILLTVGVASMLKAPQAVRKGARATERAARVGASVTPAGRVQKGLQSTARVARRSRA